MEKLDAVRDTNTLRVYSRLWLCFRDWVERESIVGVSRDSELPLPPSIVPTPVSRQPACSSTRSFPLGSRPHPSHKDVPHYRKHRHPSRWSAARSRLYARSRIQSNSSTRVTTSSASPRNHMRPRKYKRRTMPFRTRRSFPSFSWSKKKKKIWSTIVTRNRQSSPERAIARLYYSFEPFKIEFVSFLGKRFREKRSELSPCMRFSWQDWD